MREMSNLKFNLVTVLKHPFEGRNFGSSFALLNQGFRDEEGENLEASDDIEI